MSGADNYFNDRLLHPEDLFVAALVTVGIVFLIVWALKFI